MYEVELKFRIDDLAAVEQRLAALGAHFAAPAEQTDRYFAHPARDFARTDEALRLRSVGDDVVITWKGPRLAGGGKTRREIELPLATVSPGESAGAAPTLDRWTELLEALGFRRVREVVKRRRPAGLAWQGVEIEVALDRVDGLGDYLELELIATADGIPAAQAHIAALASELGCGSPEPRSYLEMVIATGT
ncbi:MAG: class IV adenylate cyclase [Planctomycetia bacterium]